jgi:glycosyltransferase involved in cell wall biosynthesis
MGLRDLGVDSLMLTRERTNNPDLLSIRNASKRLALMLASRMEQRALAPYPQRQMNAVWSTNAFPDGIVPIVNQLEADVIHLHWIGAGFLPIGAVPRFNRPIVWTQHDSWAFTGGCHLPADCVRYKDRCGNCPQLNSKREYDLSRQVLERKLHRWQKTPLTIVTPSRWLASCSQASSLFQNRRIEIIPYGLNLDVYRPIDRDVARTALGFPQDCPLVAFGAMLSTSNHNKGFHLLQPALQQLTNNGLHFEVVVFGAKEPPQPPNFGTRSHYLGVLQDDISLALLYSAVDVFVSPSLQENLPNVVLEALACGTPCVAFNIGGQPDLIDHKQNGYLAQPYEVDDLAAGIRWVLENEDHAKLSHSARQKVEQNFDMKIITRRYVDLYRELV